MRKTITSKIVISYLIVIFITLSIVGAIFNFFAQRHMENQARASLLKDAASIAEFFKKDIDQSDASENKIRQLLRDRLKLRKDLGALDSHWSIISKDQKVIFPKNAEDTAIIKNQIMPQLKRGLLKEKRNSFKVSIDGIENMAVILPVTADASAAVKGWVILYTPVGPVRELSRSLLPVLFVSLLFSGFVAVLFGIMFARSIAKPIVALKVGTERLAIRDFDSRVAINTGDELEELANTINRMAVELKDYDVAQRNFLQNASHELKSPLMSIQGYAEGIKDGVFEDNEKALQIIVDESTRLKGIVEELIYLSKLETMEEFYKFAEDSINAVIEDSIEKVKSIALKNNIMINLNLASDCIMKLDRDKFVQGIINLLSNCLRYARSEVNVTTAISGTFLEINIKDDGEGFDENEAGNVFKRFYKGKKGATGLGLAITQAIIVKHNGTITAANSETGGAEFVIRLPIK